MSNTRDAQFAVFTGLDSQARSLPVGRLMRAKFLSRVVVCVVVGLLVRSGEALASDSSDSSVTSRKSTRSQSSRHSRKRHARKAAPESALDDGHAHAVATVASAASAGPEQLTNEQINETVVSHKADIVECVRRQRADGIRASGTAVMSWVIEPSGRTSAVAATSPEFADTFLVHCLTELIEGWTFPTHAQAQDPISFPFRF
jgi:hypothetical protein